MITNNRIRPGFKLLVLFIAAIALGACGSSTPSAPQDTIAPNDWDSMQWDQGTWN